MPLRAPRVAAADIRLCRIAVVVCTMLSGGCASLGKPTWPAPGGSRMQQRRAVRFDPYPQDDIGPYLFREPLMDGTRPRDYNEPVPEIRRSRWWSPLR